VEGADSDATPAPIAKNGLWLTPCVKTAACKWPPIPIRGRIVAARRPRWQLAFQAMPWLWLGEHQLEPRFTAGFDAPPRFPYLKERAAGAIPQTRYGRNGNTVDGIRLLWALARAKGSPAAATLSDQIPLRNQTPRTTHLTTQTAGAGSGLQDGKRAASLPCPRPAPGGRPGRHRPAARLKTPPAPRALADEPLLAPSASAG